MTDYQKIYADFYCSCYDRAEILLKHFFIKRKNQKRAFGDTYNLAYNYLSDEIKRKNIIKTNKKLNRLHYLFSTRYSLYEIDQEQEIFANELKTEFDGLTNSDLLPNNYDYIKFIKDIALVEAIEEISRLMSCNSRLLEMVYKLNTFSDFEIRNYKNIALEDTPVFIKLNKQLYPQSNNQNTGLNSASDTRVETDISLLFINPAVYDCFLEYQKYIFDFYSDYSYLKKRLEKEKLIHYHKDNDFMKIVFSDLNLISEKNFNQYCIFGKLKSLEKSYSVHRQNNFNIVFGAVL